MKNIISEKTLVPISLLIAAAPLLAYIINTASRCELLANDVSKLQQDRQAIIRKVDDIQQTLNRVEISIGVIEHEIRTRNSVYQKK
jgi:hypothetical protein